MPALIALSGFVISVLLLFAGRRLALKIGFIDKPGGRKKHLDEVPPIGGLVIIPVFCGLSIYGGLNNYVSWPLLIALLSLLVMGVVDDRFQIRSWVKFFLQIAIAAFVVILGGAELQSLGNIFGLGELKLWYGAPIFSIVCFVLFMNALNMMDGMDGLAGGFAAVVLFWLMLAAALSGIWSAFWGMALMLACLLAFLAFNMRYPFHPKASVFLGDAGSLALGLLLGWFCIHLTQGYNAALPPMAVAWIIALPVIDTFALFFTRLKMGKHPFDADRNHLHHRLLQARVRPALATPLILIMAYAFGLIGYGGYKAGLPDYVLTILWVAMLAVYTGLRLKNAAKPA